MSRRRLQYWVCWLMLSPAWLVVMLVCCVLYLLGIYDDSEMMRSRW